MYYPRYVLIEFNCIPKNTEKNTKWAVNVFNSWVAARNSKMLSDKCPEDLLRKSYPTNDLARWLSIFTVEIRHGDGSEYPPKTIYNILAALLRFMRAIDPTTPNFLDQKNASFSRLHRTMDSIFHALRTKEIGVTVKHTDTISKEEEATLWNKGILSTNDPQGLLNAIFFYNGKHFFLPGGEEHRNLRLSQLERDLDFWKYQENTSKNRPGGLKTMNIEGKTVYSYVISEAGDHCHALLLDKYFEKLPPDAFPKDVFYVRPLQNWTPEGPWYSSTPVGKKHPSCNGA